MKDSKEALENLTYCVNGMESTEKYYKIIKQDLDRLEKLEKENQELLVNKNVAQGIAKKFKEENDKLKKAIEILKGFEIDLKDYCDGHYSLEILYDTGGLTKEQYELLKEVLSNEN